jgi:hypothetical protein
VINLIFLIILVIIILLILIASITLIPFHITLNLDNNGLDYKGYFKVTWLRLRILQREVPTKEEEKEEKKEVEKKAKAEWNLNRIIKIFNLFLESIPYFESIFYAFLRSVTIEKLNLNLALGMDSPVDTAQIAGFFWSLLPTVNLIPKVSIHMNPVFMKSTFEGNLEFELKIRLFWIALEGIKAITKKPVRSLINEVRA